MIHSSKHRKKIFTDPRQLIRDYNILKHPLLARRLIDGGSSVRFDRPSILRLTWKIHERARASFGNFNDERHPSLW